MDARQTPAADRARASFEAWRGQLPTDEREAFDQLQHLQTNGMPVADTEPTWTVDTIRFAHAYDTIPVSCALINRYGAELACAFAFFEKLSARGDKDFFGGGPLLEAFTGLGERTYTGRREFIADGLMSEIEPTGYDRRKRLALDMNAKQEIVLDHAERLAAQCAEHRNWSGLVNRLAYYPAAETKGLPSPQNAAKGQPSQGEPSPQNVAMDPPKLRVSEVNGVKEPCKPKPPRARASGETPPPDPAGTREPGEDDEDPSPPTASASAAEMLTAFCETNGVKHNPDVIMLYAQGQQLSPAEAARLIADAHAFNDDDRREAIKSWKWFESALQKLRSPAGDPSKRGQTPVGGHYDPAATTRVLRGLDHAGAVLAEEKQDPVKVERAEHSFSDMYAFLKKARFG